MRCNKLFRDFFLLVLRLYNCSEILKKTTQYFELKYVYMVSDYVIYVSSLLQNLRGIPLYVFIFFKVHLIRKEVQIDI